MHNYKRLSKISTGRKALYIAVASTFLLISNANATGLGRLTVLSALGQPLRAEIELTAPNKDEIASLVPKIASPDAFKQASIDFNPALLSLRFNVEPRGSGYVIRVTSSQSINEPFVDMLLELTSGNGRLIREYTFLLDPVELRNSQSAQVSNPVTLASSAPRVITQNNAASIPQNSNQFSSSASEKKVFSKKNDLARVSDGDTYHVKNGDTLNKIASSLNVDGISLDQLLVGLYKANPDAFVSSNINRLKAGQILTIPDAENMRSTGKSEAHAIVQAHAADFNSYRNKLADQVARSSVEKESPAKQTSGGTITAKVKEVPTATNESIDKLKLSKITPNSAKSSSGKTMLDEDKIAKDRAVAEANARVKELEKNVNELNNIIQDRDKKLAENQIQSAKAEQKAAEELKKAEAARAATSTFPTSTAAAKTIDPPKVAEPAVVVPPKRPAIKRRVAAPPPPEPSILDSFGGYLLPVGAVLLALLGGFGIWSSQRKKKLQQFEDSILTGSSMKANSMFGSTGGQSIDTNNSVFNSNFAPSASQLDANEVDPVAEADVYIAYGRDSQAEEILKEALRTQPDRHAVRVKLLEIYYSRKDLKSFERLASELYGMTSGEGEDWAQAASMGIVLDPANPLYAGGQVHQDLGSAALGAGTEPLEDLDPEALLGNSLSKDMLDSISVINTETNANNISLDDHDGAEISLESDDHLDEIGSLDFDLGTDDFQALEVDVPALPESTKVIAESEVASDDLSVDFASIDFDFPSEDLVKTNTSEVQDLASVDDPLNNFMGAENELDVKDENSHMPNGEVVSSDLLLGDIELSNSDSANELDPEVVDGIDEALDEPVVDAIKSVPEPFEFDLSGIDFDLNADEHKPDSPSSEGDSAFNAEMATKLDLAVAYHEIGDKDGARELLDEVLKGGTPDQVEKAKGLLAQLV